MDRLHDLIGVEHEFASLAREIRYQAHQLGAAVTGSMRLTCADEMEEENAEAFQRQVAQDLMPPLRLGRRAPFRLATVGGMYPWGAVRVAEANFGAALHGKSGFKLMVVKVSSHVFEPTGDDPNYGHLLRYGGPSTACGALHVLLENLPTSLFHDLEESLTADGVDRLDVLRDPERVPARHRMLFAALMSARLQARRVVLDLQDNVHRNPTYWLVLPCVSLNRADRDTEILCGVYKIGRAHV